jgi:HAD superfamily hydrolase (TIGR01509 family)
VAIDAVVFDFDGLLMDTESTMLASWQHEWRQNGLELDVTTFFADHGGDVTGERYAALAAAVGPGYDRGASHTRRLAFRDSLHASLDLAPGIRAWLDQAARLGVRLAVASSSPRAWVRGHLARSGCVEAFEVLAYGDEVAAPKPDPAVYLLALERLGLPGGRAVAVEDTPHGVAAAKAAGLRCVAVPNRYVERGRFSAADVVLDSAAHMTFPELLRRLGCPRPV